MDIPKLVEMIREEKSKFPEIKDFKFTINEKMTRTFGMCYFKQKIITLSKQLVLLNSEERVRNTLLHEIGHALEWVRYRTEGHGYRWYSIKDSIGSKGNRCYSKDTIRIDKEKNAEWI